MPIFDDVRTVINRLAPRGWNDLLRQHGLRLDAADLAAELVRPLVDASGKSTIDRAQPGFQDFCVAGKAAIEPANPALSLLYHALASPRVFPNPAGPRTDDDFPQLSELDTIENYIYAVARKNLSAFNNVVVAVFAYQYRTGSSSVHGDHADMVYSRTGIARVGTAPMHYDPVRRSFWPAPAGGGAGVSVMPARYAAFIAERRKLTAKDAVVHPIDGPLNGDSGRTFLVPVHKLFPGGECLAGEDTQLSFSEFHISEKLRKIHQLAPAKGGVAPLPGFNINQPPFVRQSPGLVSLEPEGASRLVVSIPHPALVQTTTQLNSNSGKTEIVRFQVPPRKVIAGGRENRFDDSSFQIPASNGRAAPEYAHIRLHVRPNGQLFDLNTLPETDFFSVLNSAQFNNVAGVENGPLEAAHVQDNSCEGAVAVQSSLKGRLDHYAAVSFVAAPDFLPLVGQIDVQRWAERNNLTGEGVYFSEGGPTPLCYGRDVTPNPVIVDPLAAPGTTPAAAFDRTDPANRTITALVSGASQGSSGAKPFQDTLSTTYLTDNAADVFAPGWDTSMFKDNKGPFYVNYGLGSPFPEDAKLCAALNSFWPASAPDVGRTFGGKTAVPLLDEELGLHPQNPKVLGGQAASHRGWDGEFGPFFLKNDSQVNISFEARSDYTIAAFEGRLGLGLLGNIDSLEQIARMDVFRECADRIKNPGTVMADFTPLLVTAEKVADWSQRVDRFGTKLTGPGYLYVFADVGDPAVDPADPKRQVADVNAVFTFQVTTGPTRLVGFRKNQGPAKITPWLHH